MTQQQEIDSKLKAELIYHDLKSPLAVIEAGVATLLNRQGDYGLLTDHQFKILRRINRNIGTLKNLINDTLELSRAEAGFIRTGSVRVSTLVLEVLTEVYYLNNVAAPDDLESLEDLAQTVSVLEASGFGLQVQENLWDKTIEIDEDKLRQILRNLLSNAFKYRKNRITVRIENAGNDITFIVADDGKGIAPEDHQKVFYLYTSLDDVPPSGVRGHGIGLPGAYMLARIMGGSLKLESAPGQGTRFIVRLPLSQL
jgi:two-component system, OmpR family, sensor kinase